MNQKISVHNKRFMCLKMRKPQRTSRLILLSFSGWQCPLLKENKIFQEILTFSIKVGMMTQWEQQCYAVCLSICFKKLTEYLDPEEYWRHELVGIEFSGLCNLFWLLFGVPLNFPYTLRRYTSLLHHSFLWKERWLRGGGAEFFW